MKKQLKINAFRILVITLCSLQLQFIQPDSPTAMNKLGKGTLYLKQNRIIKNIRLIEFKKFWIVYEKEGNLHDKMIDEILHIEFLNALSDPVDITFDKNIPVIRKIVVQ